jgi:hypothetical protein
MPVRLPGHGVDGGSRTRTPSKGTSLSDSHGYQFHHIDMPSPEKSDLSARGCFSLLVYIAKGTTLA